MLGLNRSAASYTWTAAIVLLLLWLLYVIHTTVFIFILALLFAYLLAPLVNLLDRFLGGRRTRTLALALSYIILVAAVIVIGTQVGTRIVEEANSLAQKFPAMLAKWEQQPLTGAAAVNSLKDQILDKIRTELIQSSTNLVSALPKVGLRAITVVSNIVYIVIIPILGFFFLKDGRAFREHILEMVHADQPRKILDDVLADINLLLAGYMRALVLLSLFTFTAYSIFLLIIGESYAVLLAAIAALLEFIPIIGPLAAGALVFILSALAGVHPLAVLIFLLAYRVFQDYVVAPHIMGQGVELHPLVVMFGVFAGAEAAGIGGAFLSVPILALVRIMYLRIRRARVAVQPAALR